MGGVALYHVDRRSFLPRDYLHDSKIVKELSISQ